MPDEPGAPPAADSDSSPSSEDGAYFIEIATHPAVSDAEQARRDYEASMESYAPVPDAGGDDDASGPLDTGMHPIAPGENNALTLRRRGPIILRDHRGSPLAGAPYVLIANGDVTEGTTDELGYIGFVDTTQITEGDIYVADKAYHVKFGDDPGDPVTHGQSMLNALGYSAGPLDGTQGPRTRSATSYYQIDRGLEVTGELDDATIEALEAEHRPEEGTA